MRLSLLCQTFSFSSFKKQTPHKSWEYYLPLFSSSLDDVIALDFIISREETGKGIAPLKVNTQDTNVEGAAQIPVS